MKRYLLLLYLLFPLVVAAQSLPYASALLERDEIVIGEQIKMNIEVRAGEEHFLWVPFPPTLCDGVEVVAQTAVDTLREEGITVYRQALTLTSFDTGFYIIPPIDFPYQLADDTTLLFCSIPASMLTVNTIAVDTTQAFMDIKGVREVPVTFREVLLTAYPWVILTAVLVGLFFIGRTIYRRRKNRQPIFVLPKKPKTPAHIIAFEALDQLKEKKLWQSDRVKDYYSELTDIIDRYIEDRFEVFAVEMTTDEIIAGLSQRAINQEDINRLQSTLELSDLVKFAKSNPLPLENDGAWNNMYDFVRHTKLEQNLTSESVVKDSPSTNNLDKGENRHD